MIRRWTVPALGAVILIVYLSIASLGNLRGATTVDFLARYFLAFGLYVAALIAARREVPDRREWGQAVDPSRVMWVFAVAFRVALLFSPPTLSDDVYRYIWDGRVQHAGINPYAYRVDAPELDAWTTPSRAQVNNAWMASPYLPVAQIYFAATYRLAPESTAAFQLGAVIFDLAAGLFLTLTLRRIGSPAAHAMIYLWNPLVIIEVAHGAHVDALMTMLMMAALWLLSCEDVRRASKARRTYSAILLGLATLVKPIPAVLAPILMWRWGWKQTLVYGAVVAIGIAAYAGAGLGLETDLTGTGIFGATRIYLSRWNFNGGLFHWLEVALTGVQTPGAVPIELAGPAGPAARWAMLGALVVAVMGVSVQARRVSNAQALLRLSLLPLGAYVLLATTMNPWYLIPLIAVLPFQVVTTSVVKPSVSGATEVATTRLVQLQIVAWLYFSAAVALSYLTYLDPLNLRETYAVRAIEYLPLYALLIAAAVVSWAKRSARRSAASTA